MILEVTKITIYVQKYGMDVLNFRTTFLDPANILEGDEERLELTCRAPRLKGEAFARQTWPDAEIEVMEWTEKRGYAKPD